MIVSLIPLLLAKPSTSTQVSKHCDSSYAKQADQLEKKIAIAYGCPKARYKLTNYFDLGCTHCLKFYREVFPKIKKKFCDTGKLLFIYTPYPIHSETIAYMSCCTVLSDAQKQALFETLMELDDITTNTIHECMKVLKVPPQDPTSTILKEALRLTDQHKFDALPVMFLNGKRLRDENQDNIIEFLDNRINHS